VIHQIGGWAGPLVAERASPAADLMDHRLDIAAALCELVKRRGDRRRRFFAR